MLKRIVDIVLSILAILVLAPIFIFIVLAIVLESKGGVFFSQRRVGKNSKIFKLYKFRSMRPNSESKGLLTVGGRDPRITRSGYYLRKFKLDELPQLFNILKGDMSIVGPRPEVEKYVNLYSLEQKKILLVRPGLTDYASLAYINENEILSQSAHPEKTYIEVIMPAKLALNLKYISDQSFLVDLKIIWRTLVKIVS